MAASRFDPLVTVEDWAAELGTILRDVELAVESGEFRKKLELQDLLLEFVESSPMAAASLDRIARRAADDLLRTEIRDAVAGITARNEELRKATAQIRQGTDEAKGAARVLQFEKVAETLESARAGIEALKTMGEGLTDGDAELTDRLVEIAGAIEEFQRLAGGKAMTASRAGGSRSSKRSPTSDTGKSPTKRSATGPRGARRN